ncbi:MAG: putative lipid II flippase FtsW [Parachlamydiaceae bacterium]|nr:putative lipid II flippase FtsW [Parachlamydiaceae bacterium]
MRFFLVICVAALFMIGIVTIFSTTSAEVLDHDLDRSFSYAVLKQLYYGLTGLILGGIVWKVGYRRFLQYSPALLYFSLFLLILTLIPGIGREVNGSRRWLALMGFSFQPSEFVKYVVPAYFIHRFLILDELPWTFWKFLRLISLPLLAVLLILVEPNNGTAAVVGITMLLLCLLMRLPAKYWAFPLIGFSLLGAVFASQLPYVTARLNVYLHPELDIRGKGHQPHQAKIAAGSGGMLGRGPGNSLQKLSYLPEAQNDYIAAIYAEEFGFIGVIILLALYAAIAYIGFHAALHAVDRAGFYFGGAILFLICFQAFLNLGVVSGLLPSTGLNLPFFSQGGSSLMANLAGISFLLQLIREDPMRWVNSEC